jgi:hypothetical protein
MWKNIFRAIWFFIGLVVFAISLPGVPENLRIWEQWISGMSLSTDLDFYRYIFLVCGSILIFISLDLHRKLWAVIRKPPLIIEHENSEADYYRESQSFSGLSTFNTSSQLAPFRLCRISIYNSSTKKTIRNIKVKLLKIRRLPVELRGKLPLNLRFQHHLTNELGPRERKFIDVIQQEYDEARPIYNITNIDIPERAKFPIRLDENDYEIEIQAISDTIASKIKKFSFGIKNQDNTTEKIWLWPI